MSRLAVLASSALIALTTAAHAAPLTFQASRTGSSLLLTCGKANTACTRLEADLDIEDSPLPKSTLGPAYTFDFIEFDGIKPSKQRDKNTPLRDDQQKIFGDSFGITAKLAFRIMGVPGLYDVIARGKGNFIVEGKELTFLDLIWEDIAPITIPGRGTLAFSFSNIGGPSLFAARNGGGSDDSVGENDDDIILSVNATVENISVVPLPGGVILLFSALGLLGIGAARRRATTA